MPDFNAGLLQVGDLAGVIGRGRQQKMEEQQMLLNQLGQGARSVSGAFDQDALNQALANNFDPETQQLNQKGVISELYKYKPQMAQQMASQFQAQQAAGMKAQGDYAEQISKANLNNAQAGKAQSEAGTVQLQQQLDKQKQMGQLILGAQDQAGMNKAIEFAKANGWDTSLYENAPFSPALKQQAMGYLIQANDQVKNMIDQQRANADSQNAQSTSQNANSTTMNALTGQQRANQDYELGTNRNNIDMYRANLENQKVQNEIATKGMMTPAQMLEYQKSQNELQSKKVEQSNKAQEKVSSLEYTNQVLKTFGENAQRLLTSPLLSQGINPQSGDVLRDKSGKVVPADSNSVGGVFGTLARMAPGSNDYKAIQRDYDTLVGTAKGKTMAEFKSAIGSTGPVTDADAKNFAAMQQLPDNFDDFVKLDPQRRVDALDDIRNISNKSIENNTKLIEKANKQNEMIANQSLNLPQTMPRQSAPAMYNNNIPQAMDVSGIPPLRDGVFKAPNGYVLTPAMFARILKQQQGG